MEFLFVGISLFLLTFSIGALYVVYRVLKKIILLTVPGTKDGSGAVLDGDGIDNQFQRAISLIMNHGSTITTRNSTVKRYRNISFTFKSNPLLSLRRTAWKSSIREFEWFLSGSSNIADLHPSVHKWWEPWANTKGEIYNNYSKQFRHFNGEQGEHFDQIKYLIGGIKNHPYSRRNVITAWNTSDMADLKTPITSCHNTSTQLFVEEDGTLHMTTYQRSADMMLGLPHNFTQQWAFLSYLAYKAGRDVGSMTVIVGDAHIYENHFEAANVMINTTVPDIKTPDLVYKPTSVEFLANDFTLKDEYKPLSNKSLPMTV